MVRSFFTPLFIAGTIAVLGACAPLPIKDVAQKAAVLPADDAEQIPVLFEKIQIKLRRGDRVGRYQGMGFLCTEPYGDITWGAGRISGRDIGFADIFHDRMKEANYDIVGDPDRLFDKGEDFARAELRIAGSLNELTVNLCNRVNILGIPVGITGDAYVKVNWQVYSIRERRVIFKTTTEGRGENKQPTDAGFLVATESAFESAVGNLAANPDLRELLIRKEIVNTEADLAVSKRAPKREVIQIAKQKLFKTSLTGHINSVRNTAVTISVGGGHGSGFFISADGLLITNNHVVGEARFVTVQLLSGREVVGEVLRRHKKRDVALVLVEGNGYDSLPVRSKPLSITEEVFAIGTPRRQDLATTVSKGIVSAIRVDRRDGLEIIQADVDIHGGNSGGPLVDKNGNLVGISVAGFSAAGDSTKSSVGLNFFIPIKDAFAKLKLELADLPKNYSAVKRLPR